jgi:hypothetical protein
MTRAERALVLPWAIVMAGCFATETEVITAGQSIRLCSKRFYVQMGDEPDGPSRFAWNEGSKAYVEVKGEVAVRFARFKGDFYLGQMQGLRGADDGSSPPGKKGYAIGLVRLSQGRLTLVVEPNCEGRHLELEAVARGYGVTLERGGYVSSLHGKREGILGFLTSVLECDLDPPPHMNPPLVAEAVIPGGPELAAQAGLYRGEMFAEPERRACEDGTLRSCYVLGARYVKGDGVARDPARAAPLLTRACEGGLAGACLDLAELYATGSGVAVDAARARTLYEKSCRLGEPFACERLKQP